MTKQGRTLELNHLIKLGKWVEDDLQRRTSIHLLYSWPLAFFNSRRLLNEDNGTCGIKNILGILSTGHLAMCGIGMQVPDLCYGKLGMDSVSEIWTTHPALVKLRNSLVDELKGVCGQCILRNQCSGFCVADNYRQKGSMAEPYWFCQQALEENVFPITRLK